MPTSDIPIPGKITRNFHLLARATVLAAVITAGVPMAARGQVATQPAANGGVKPEDTKPLEGLPIARVEVVSFDPRKPLRDDPRMVLDQVRAQAGQNYSLAVVDLDMRTIAALGRYVTVSVDVVKTADNKVVVRYIVEERPLVTAVEIKGNFKMSDLKIKEVIGVKSGTAVDQSEIRADIQAITALYKKDGYSQSGVTVDQDLLRNQGIVCYSIVEGPRTQIGHVVFEGNAHITSDYLSWKIKTKSHFWFFRKGVINDDDIESDLVTIRDAYVGRGYLDARVSRSIETSADKTDATVRFIINEGPRYRVGKITIEGNKVYSTQDLMDLFTIKPGDFVDRKLLDTTVKHLEDVYGKQGYIYRTVDVKTAYTNQAAVIDMTIVISEGDSYSAGPIIIRGNANTQDKVIRRQIRVYPDQTIDTTLVRKSIERLKGTRLVTDVKISPIGDTPGVRNILVEVQEGQTGRFLIGAGISTNTGIIGQLSLEQSNFDITNPPTSWREFLTGQSFKGAGQFFQILLEPGTQVQRYRIRFEEPYLFDSPYSFSNDLYFFTRARESYDEQRIGDIVTFGRRFGDIWSASFALRAEQVDIKSVTDNGVIGVSDISTFVNSDGSLTEFADSAQEIIDAKGAHFLTSVKPGLVRDTTDSKIFPTEGTITGFSVEQYGAMGGELTFTKLVGRFNWYAPLYSDLFDRKTVFALRNEVDMIPVGNSVFYERFYGGGIGSLRGFKFRGISPRSGPLNDPVGGDFAWTTTGEVNYPIYEELMRGVVFTDIGTVERNIDIGTVRSDVGFGFRLTLPFFGQLPLAVDFAVPLSKAAGDRTQIISFSLGLPF